MEESIDQRDSRINKKDVSTGELLPNTGVRILDKDKNIIIEGRTNEKGVFTFKNLPKGMYYFQEFDAPKGYQLDETPIQFEIKEHEKVVKCEMTNQKIETPTKPAQSLPQTGDTNHIGFIISWVALGILYLCRKNSKTE